MNQFEWGWGDEPYCTKRLSTNGEFKCLLTPGRQTNKGIRQESWSGTKDLDDYQVENRRQATWYQENSGKLASSLGFKSSATFRSSPTLQQVKNVKRLSSHLNSTSLKMSFSCPSTIPSFLCRFPFLGVLPA